MTLTLDELKKVVLSDEDVIIIIDGSILEEIDEEDETFIMAGSDYLPIDDNTLSCIEILEFTELELSMDTLYAVYKEDSKGLEPFERKYMALDSWNSPVNDIEEELFDYGMRRIEKIVKINKVKNLKKWGIK